MSFIGNINLFRSFQYSNSKDEACKSPCSPLATSYSESASCAPEIKMSSSQISALSAEFAHFIFRVLTEHLFFQSQKIPQDLFLSLTNSLIHEMSDERKETISVVKEVTILWKRIKGTALSREEEIYDNSLKEINVVGEALNGIKYSSIALMGQSFYSSVTSAIQQRLWTHLPAIFGYSGTLLLGSHGISLVVDKILLSSSLTQDQQTLVRPWLNTIGRLALGFVPKVQASQEGVHYHYPSLDGSTQTFSKNQTITIGGESLIIELQGQLETAEGTFEAVYLAQFKLHHIELDKEKVQIQVVNSDGKTVPIEFEKIQGDYGPRIIVRSTDQQLEKYWSQYFHPRESIRQLSESSSFDKEISGNRAGMGFACKVGIAIGTLAAAATRNPLLMALGGVLYSDPARALAARQPYQEEKEFSSKETGVCEGDSCEDLITIDALSSSLLSIGYSKDEVQSLIGTVLDDSHKIENLTLLTDKLFEKVLSSYDKILWGSVDKDIFKELKNTEGLTLFQAAIKWGSLDCVWILLKNFKGSKAIYALDSTHKTALHIAAIEGHHVLVDLLSDHFSLDDKDQEGLSALHWAIHEGHAAFVEALIKQGASLIDPWVAPDGTEFLPLSMAVAAGNPEVLEIFLREDALKQVDLMQSIPGIGTTLHIAIQSNQAPMLKYILEVRHTQTKGLLELKDQFGRTPLQLAAFLGDLNAIDLLHSQGAELNRGEGEKGGTAVHYAVLGGQPDAVRFLDYLGANLVATDREGNTPKSLLKSLPSMEISDASKRCEALLTKLTSINRIAPTRPPNFQRRPPINLVFQGGGPKGLAYVGILLEMERLDLLSKVRRLAGTSAGAITAALVSVGYKASELESLLALDFSEFLDTQGRLEKDMFNAAHPLSKESLFRALLKEYWDGWTTLLHPIERGKELYSRLSKLTGLCSGEKLRLWIEDLIYKKTKTSHCTFRELERLVHEHPESYKELYLFSTQIQEKGSAIIKFSHEDPQWKDLVIADAVRASLSIPGVFEPTTLYFKDEAGNRYPRPHYGQFIDGGLIRNFPLDAFDEHRYQEDRHYRGEKTNRRTLGFSLQEVDELVDDNPFQGIASAEDLVKAVVFTYFHAEEILKREKSHNQDRTVSIPIRGVTLLDFHLTPAQKSSMIQSGRESLGFFFNPPQK